MIIFIKSNNKHFAGWSVLFFRRAFSFFTFLLAFSCLSGIVLGQCPPSPPGYPYPPSISTCGVINPTFSVPSADTCFSDSVIVNIQTSVDVDTIYICWGDNTMDIINCTAINTTILQSFTHLFNFPPDSCICAGNIAYPQIDINCVLWCNSGQQLSAKLSTTYAGIKFKPRPRFSAPDTTCINSPVGISIPSCPTACANASSTDSTQFIWDYGDGVINNDTLYSFAANIPLPAPAHIYTTPGLFQICLTATNSCGTSVYCRNVRVLPEVIMNPVISGDSCTVAILSAHANVQFEDSLLWSFTLQPNPPGGSISNTTGNNPTITITEPGTYTLQLEAYDFCCGFQPLNRCLWDTTFTILSGPTISTPAYPDDCSIPIDFINDFNLTVGDSLFCSIDSLNINGSFSIYFDNSGNPPPQLLTIPGTYVITVTAKNNCGPETRQDTVIVLPPTIIQPVAQVTQPNCSGDTIFITTTNAQFVGTYLWSGTTPPLLANNIPLPYFITSSPGVFNIQLDVTGCCTSPLSICTWDTLINFDPGPQLTPFQLNDGCDSISLNFMNDFQLNTSDSIIYTIDSLPLPAGNNYKSFQGITPSPVTLYGPGTFIIQIQAKNNCDSTPVFKDTVTIFPYTVIMPTLTLPVPPCAPDSIQATLNANYTTNIIWRGHVISPVSASITVNNPGLPNPKFYADTAGTYSVAVEVAGCCTSPLSVCYDSLTFTLGQGPLLDSVTSPADNCDSILVDFSAMYQFNSIDNLTFSIDRLLPAPAINVYSDNTSNPPVYWISTPGTYYISASADNVCGNKVKSDTVTLYDRISVSLPADTQLCISETLDLSAYSGYSYPSPPGYWIINHEDTIPGGLFIASNYDSIINTIYYSYNPGLINCISVDSFFVEVLGEDINAGADDTVCINDAAFTLTGFPSGPNGSWTGSGVNLSGLLDPSLLPSGPHPVYFHYDYAPGCILTDTVIILVEDTPSTAYSPVPDFACIGDSILFNYTGSQSVVTWHFGDTSPDVTGNTVYHQYQFASTFYFSFTVTDSLTGCKSISNIDSIVVSGFPVAQFTATPVNPCAFDTITVTNDTINNLTSYTWSYGSVLNFSGITPGQIIFPFIYTDSTKYLIVEIAGNNCGSDTSMQSVTVYTPAQANFSIPINPPCTGDTVFLTNNSWGYQNTYQWLVNGALVSTDFEPSGLILSTSGTYQLMLIVSNLCDTDSITHTLTVSPAQIFPGFTISNQMPCKNDTVKFTSNLLNYKQITWYWGDNTNPDTGYFSQHAYSNAGTYIVWQVVQGFCGRDSISDTITVLDVPIVLFSAVPPFCENQPILFAIDSLNSNAFLYTYYFGDGDSLKPGPFLNSHLYNSTGPFSVMLVGTSTNGCRDTATLNLSLLPAPDAQFSYGPVDTCLGLPVTFLSTNQNVTYTWDPGNGSLQAGNPVSYTYFLPGTYPVTLTVTDNSNCSDTASGFVFVRPRALADFTSHQWHPCNTTDTLYFVNQSINAGIYNWNFGLYGSSVDENPFVLYTAQGTIPVTLVADNIYGCKDDTTASIAVSIKPSADFDLSPDTICSGESILLSNLTLNATQFLWLTGNGMQSTLLSPEFIFNSSGSQTITLVAANDSLCRDTITRSFLVYDIPRAGITAIRIDSLVNNTETDICSYYQFNDSSSADVVSWRWYFSDDQSISSEKDPTHYFSENGTYTVSLVVTNSFNCMDSVSKIFEIICKGHFIIPNALAPVYQPGEAGYFIIKGERIKNYQVQIYAPDQTLVWSAEESPAEGVPDARWDGKYQNKDMPQGTYVVKYSVSFTNVAVKQGVQTIQLIR